MSTTILALDASSTTIGYAVVVEQKPIHVSTAVLRGSIGARIDAAEQLLARLLAKWSPAMLAIEAPAYHAKPLALIAQQRVAGVLLLLAYRSAIPVVEIPPSEVKKTFTGSGTASKEQMQQVAKLWSGLACDEHGADALAVAWAAMGKR